MAPSISSPAQVLAPRARRTVPGAWDQALLLGYGALLAGLLVSFRTNLYANEPVDFQGWLAPAFWLRCLFDAGLVGAIEAGWWLLGGIARGRSLKLWRIGVVLSHLFLIAVEICSEQYFLACSQRLRPSYAFFVLVHPPGRLGSIIGANLGARFFARALAAAGSFILVPFLARRVRRPPLRWRPRQVATGVLVAALGLLALPAPAQGRAIEFGPSLLAGFLRAMSQPLVGRSTLVRQVVHYAPPKIVGPAPAAAPNMLLVVLESTRADLIRPLPDGGPPAMPFLSNLASQGLNVVNTEAGVNHTTKALVTIFCGMYPELHMEAGDGIGHHQPLQCLPKLLGAAGYQTAYFQSAFGGIENRPRLVHEFGFQEQTMADSLAGRGFQKVGYLGVDEFAMLDPAVDWMAHARRPFFLGMLTSSTHHPYQAPGQSEPSSLAARWPSYRIAAGHVDQFLSALMGRLRQKGLLDDTIIVVVGDHGESFGDGKHPGFGGHDACPYDECMHVPLVLYGPKWLGPPRTVEGLRHQVDLLPTLLNLSGAKWIGALPGEDLLKTTGHQAVFMSCYWERTCLVERTGNLAAIYSFEDPPLEIFNLRVDPSEEHDLAPLYPDDFLQARTQELLSFQEAVNYYYATVVPPPTGSGPAERP